jgi:AraC-like DNA-binding protein
VQAQAQSQLPLPLQAELQPGLRTGAQGGARLWPGPWLAGTATEGVASALNTLPDTATTLIVRREPGAEPEVLVAGPRTRALYHQGGPGPGPSCLQLRIRPGLARPLVGRALAELADRTVLLAEDRAADLIGLLEAMAPWDRVRPVVESWLAPARTGDRERSALVADAARLLAPAGLGGSGLGVAEVARRLHISERQLRNLFAQAVGVSPKRLAGIDRVRTVLARGPRDGLAGAAAHAGYYDQPHMTAEFRRVMGIPPAAYLAGHRPPPTPCTRRALGPLGSPVGSG